MSSFFLELREIQKYKNYKLQITTFIATLPDKKKERRQQSFKGSLITKRYALQGYPDKG